MLYFAFLSLLNGIVVSFSRVMNGRLSAGVGPFKASLWNHIIGFLFITLILIFRGELTLDFGTNVPSFTYLGGVCGALFVALNSYVFSRMGATLSILLVIGGQMISSVLIDSRGGSLGSLLGQGSGVLLILYGVYLAKNSKQN